MDQEQPNRMEMSPDGDPIADNLGLPSMDDVIQPESDIMGSMDSAAMPQMMSEPAPDAEEQADAYPDMEPMTPSEGSSTADFAVGDYDDGYVRLLVNVDNGAMQVTDAKVVGGPLSQDDLVGQLAYQAVVNDRRVGAGALSDISVQHAYAHPDSGEIGHRVVESDSYEFMVRIPRSELTLEELGSLEIELVRPANTSTLSNQSDAAHGATFMQAAAAVGEPDPEVIARLEGVQLDALSQSARDSLQNGLR